MKATSRRVPIGWSAHAEARRSSRFGPYYGWPAAAVSRLLGFTKICFVQATICYISDSLSVEWSKRLCHSMQDCSKPYTSWVGMLRCRMQQVFMKRSNVQRHRQHIEIEDSGVRTDEPLRNDRDEIGLGHDMQGLEVVRNS